MCTIVLLSAYQVVALEYGNARASITGVVLPIQGAFASAMMSPLIRRSSTPAVRARRLRRRGHNCGRRRGLPQPKGPGVVLLGGHVGPLDGQEPHRAVQQDDHQLAGGARAPRQRVRMLPPRHLAPPRHSWAPLAGSVFQPTADGLARGAIFLATSGALIICAFGFIALVRATGPPAKDAHSRTSTSSGDESSESDDGVAGSASDEEVSTENAYAVACAMSMPSPILGESAGQLWAVESR
eukprot:CAMPEP_0176247348 /NCGR_PEP_ID=MMETSP0121_2-20121125/32908_1 /TAXON_ID=160619 /ORGANISM="Kryptoperidinium foliaceum, Strain CCMP 1326" /LENGTH=239 /DNA_ID=CAMNT_0017586999 /DNA_START=1 /DNA_END=719 /DNA_ORIENTATION=+